MDNIPFLGTSIWLIAKLFVLFAILIYLVFAAVVIRQVNLMTETLEVEFNAPIKIAAIGHFVVTVAVFLIALLIL